MRFLQDVSIQKKLARITQLAITLVLVMVAIALVLHDLLTFRSIMAKEMTSIAQIIGSNSATKHDLEVMMPLLESGKLKTVIDRVFPLREAAQAHRYLESAKQFGKVVLRVEH